MKQTRADSVGGARRVVEASGDGGRGAQASGSQRKRSDLTTFVVETAKLNGVDEWERSRLQKVREDAEARRQEHRVNAGKALQAMRLRGETIAAISQQAGVSAAVVRRLLQAAAKEAPASGGQDPGTEAAAPPAATATGDGAAPDGRGQSGAERTPHDARRRGGHDGVAAVVVDVTRRAARLRPLWVDPVAHAGEIARFERFVVAGPDPAD